MLLPRTRRAQQLPLRPIMPIRRRNRRRVKRNSVVLTRERRRRIGGRRLPDAQPIISAVHEDERKGRGAHGNDAGVVGGVTVDGGNIHLAFQSSI